MPYCLLSFFSDTVVPNILSKSNLGRNNPSKTDLGRNGCPLYPNNLSKTLLGYKRLHTQTNALAKQSLKDLPLLYGDHKAG